jgi:hypothetical protein
MKRWKIFSYFYSEKLSNARNTYVIIWIRNLDTYCCFLDSRNQNLKASTNLDSDLNPQR